MHLTTWALTGYLWASDYFIYTIKKNAAPEVVSYLKQFEGTGRTIDQVDHLLLSALQFNLMFLAVELAVQQIKSGKL